MLVHCVTKLYIMSLYDFQSVHVRRYMIFNGFLHCQFQRVSILPPSRGVCRVHPSSIHTHDPQQIGHQKVNCRVRAYGPVSSSLLC